MSHASIRWSLGQGTNVALCLTTLVLGDPLLAAPAGRPSTKTQNSALPEGEKREAVRQLFPATPDAELPTVLGRLEESWRRAKAMGLLDSLTGKEALERNRREVLGKALLDSRPGHPMPSEDQLKTLFLGQGEERHVSHLVCRTEAEARAALERLRAGEAFSVVAPEVSIDPSALQNQGDLGWIRQKQLVKSFGDPVFAAAAGALIGPLQTDFGWHVVKVLDVRSPKPEDFPAAKGALLKEAYEAQTAMKRQAMMEGLRERYPLRPDMALLGLDRSLDPVSGDEKRVAGRVAGSSITLRELKLHMSKTFKSGGSSHSLGATIKRSFLEGLADKVRLAAAAKALGLHLKPAVRSALWAGQCHEAYLLFSQAYLAKLEVPESALAQHHSSYSDRFLAVGAVRLQVLVCDSEEAGLQAMDQLRLGMPWRKAVAEYGNIEATGNPEPGWVEVTDLLRLVPLDRLKSITTGALGQPVGPFLAPDGYTILNVLGRRSGALMPLAECRDQVRADYVKVHGRELVDRALSQ